MPEFDNTNRGAMFRNDRKKEGSKEPDYRGTLNVAGTDYELAGWKRTSKKGVAFLSLTIQLPRNTNDQRPAPMDNEDIPF
jgi:uncharacterized protein (DUF736 family)